MSPEEFAAGFICRWEDGGSTDPARTHSMRREDAGNWSGGVVGSGALIGSNHGVTPKALAAWRKVPVNLITYDVMHGLTIEEAGRIALASYYHAPRLDLLPWNQWTASIFDAIWGMGASQGVKLLQRQIGSVDDGKIGPATTEAANAHIRANGLNSCAWEWAFIRARFYGSLAAKRPANSAFLNGWNNRTASFTPSDPWWKEFSSDA